MPEITASAGIHSRNEHKIAGECDLCGGTGYSHLAVLKGLTESISDLLCKLRKLVKKEDTVV